MCFHACSQPALGKVVSKNRHLKEIVSYVWGNRVEENSPRGRGWASCWPDEEKTKHDTLSQVIPNKRLGDESLLSRTTLQRLVQLLAFLIRMDFSKTPGLKTIDLHKGAGQVLLWVKGGEEVKKKHTQPAWLGMRWTSFDGSESNWHWFISQESLWPIPMDGGYDLSLYWRWTRTPTSFSGCSEQE